MKTEWESIKLKRLTLVLKHKKFRGRTLLFDRLGNNQYKKKLDTLNRCLTEIQSKIYGNTIAKKLAIMLTTRSYLTSI